MENSINQLYTLFVFILSGAVIGILFDLFRILRKSFSLIIGIVIYFLTISKYFIKLNIKIIRIYKIYYIKNFIRSILPYKNNI